MKNTNTKRATAAVAVAAPAKRPWWLYPAGLALALIVVFQVYGPALNGPFLYDDSYLPYVTGDFAHFPLIFYLRGLRPILMLSFWLNYQQSGNQVTYSYHAWNVILHFFNSILVYMALRKVLTWAKVERPGLEILSVFGAGLFLLHPIQTESVSYVASRSETLSVFFLLGAYVVFLYRRTTGISFGAAIAVILLFGAAALSKEHAIALVGVLLLTDYFWNPGFTFEGLRRNWKLYALAAAVGTYGAIFALRIVRSSPSAGFSLKDLTWYQFFFTECRAIWEYFRMFLLPYGQNLDHDFPVSHTIFEHGAIVGLVGLLALIGFAWHYRRRFPLISYGVFTTLILFAPTSSFVPIQDVLVEHRLYLPFIGLLFVTVGLLRFWKTSASTLAFALSFVLLAEAVLTYQRNELYSSSIAIWRDSAAEAPNKSRPHFQLAFAYYQAGKCADAQQEYAKAAQLDKPDYRLLVDWGLAYDCAGDSVTA